MTQFDVVRGMESLCQQLVERDADLAFEMVQREQSDAELVQLQIDIEVEVSALKAIISLRDAKAAEMEARIARLTIRVAQQDRRIMLLALEVQEPNVIGAANADALAKILELEAALTFNSRSLEIQAERHDAEVDRLHALLMEYYDREQDTCRNG